MSEGAIRAAFRRQAGFCARMGAAVSERVVAGLADALSVETETGRRVLDWPGDPLADALPLRLLGGVHALHQSGAEPLLAPLFEDRERDPARVREALATVLARHDAALLPWLDGPPQTNELGRSGALMAGLLTVADELGPRMELLEIGSSAGLNLLIDRVRIELGGVVTGPFAATIQLRPEWRGPPPPTSRIEIVAARGVDLAPIDVADPAQAARLRAYVWAGVPDRLARMDAAIAMVAERPIRLEAGDAADWTEQRLAEPQADGVTRVLMHSVVWQYLPDATQRRIEAAMAAAGSRATPERPLAWVAMEPELDLARHDVRVRWWRGDGEDEPWRRVAVTHPHGAWIEGLPSVGSSDDTGPAA